MSDKRFSLTLKVWRQESAKVAGKADRFIASEQRYKGRPENMAGTAKGKMKIILKIVRSTEINHFKLV